MSSKETIKEGFSLRAFKARAAALTGYNKGYAQTAGPGLWSKILDAEDLTPAYKAKVTKLKKRAELAGEDWPLRVGRVSMDVPKDLKTPRERLLWLIDELIRRPI